MLALMVARFAKTYIDRLYEARDMFALAGVIDVVGREQNLPEQFWLSQRIWAWCGWSRSGIWQYYESISQKDFDAIAASLERFGLPELAARYRSGKEAWKEPGGCKGLDCWIDAHWSELESTAFQLIANDRHCLYGQS